MIEVTPPPGTCTSAYEFKPWTRWRPFYGMPFELYPDADVLCRRLGAGDPPAPGAYRAERRVDQLRRAGVPLPVPWRDRARTVGEAEIEAALEYTGWLWWSEVVAGRRETPWRLDFVFLAPRDDRWALIGVEVDGPTHRERREADARRDRCLLAAYGIEVYRVQSEWAVVDPWATLDAVARSAGVEGKPEALVPGLDELWDYSCRVCGEAIQRRNPADLAVRAGHGAHTECNEAAERWIGDAG